MNTTPNNDDQLTMFPALPAPPPPETERVKRTPGEIRRARQDTAIHHGQHPLTAALGTGIPLHSDPERTCGNCRFRVPVRSPSGNRQFPKCLVRDPEGRLLNVTHGPGTDVLKWWPACHHHEYQAVNESSEGGSA